MRRALKIGGIGCGGLIALVIVISVLVAALGGKSKPSAAKTPTAAIPATVASKIRAFAGPDAYLPSFLPPRYRYASWRMTAPTKAASMHGRAWFSVRFAKGAERLTWQVMVETEKDFTATPCGMSSAGHATYGGQTAYWSLTGTQAAKKYGMKAPRGRNFWTCRKATGGDDLFIALSSNSESLPTSAGARVAASASAQ